MAQKVTVHMVDDFDGGEAVETVRFGLDNVNYEVDLSEENAALLRDAIAPWIKAGRRDTTTRKPRRAYRSTGSPMEGLDGNAVRSWAREHGHTVSDRGRVAAQIVDEYRQAHNL